jgi:formylglycine-generating enzyme required for sulfatase activity
LAVVATVVVAAAVALGRTRGPADHIELKVSNPARAQLSLRRAGATLDEAQPVELGEGGAWVPPGNYFVEALGDNLQWFYTVPVATLGRGPESHGAYAVAVRAPVFGVPPAPAAGVPGFVYVPAGNFEMGDRHAARQSHYVWVAAFFLAAFEVTNGEFRQFLRDPEGYDERRNWTEAGWRWREGGVSQVTARYDPTHPRYPRFGRDDQPVVLATWFEADAYCRWLSRRLGQGRWQFRLPTEAEWEKAARGPDAFDYGLGMRLSEPEAPLYNWKKNPEAAETVVGVEGTRARYRRNRYGLWHMSGNVGEWTQTVSRAYNWDAPYRDDDRNHSETPGLRVTRGGSWYSASSVRLYLGYREEFQPELSSDDLGFRIAAVPRPDAPASRVNVGARGKPSLPPGPR